MQQACEQTTGGMAAIIGEERAKVQELCREFDIEAANFNAPGQIIVSGEKTKVGAAVAAAKDRGMKKVMPLNVAGAYHSPIDGAGARGVCGVSRKHSLRAHRNSPSSRTQPERPSAILRKSKSALVKQVVSSVLWEDCMRSAAAAGATEFWELGPGGVLSGLARRTEKTWTVKSFSEFADVAAA